MEDNHKYYPRICDALLKGKLHSSGAVLIEGAKWCGKTSTASHVAGSILYLQDPDQKDGYMKLADTKPSLLLRGETPRLIDEWQMSPVLWDAVRYEVDRRQLTGQFILTGSATPNDKSSEGQFRRHHSGAGRISRLLMRPMSLWESMESTGEVSLSALFDGQKDVEGISKLSVEDIASLICRGGWPFAVVNKDRGMQMALNYVDTITNEDVQQVDGVERNPVRARLLLRSYARNISTMAAFSTIRGDLEANEKTLSENTVYDYVNAFKRMFVIEDVPAWQPSLRSKTAIRTSDKRQFVDPSIATAVMNAGPGRILSDFKYFGFLFESLAVRDIRIYAQGLGGEIRHYRDKSDLEADIIITLSDGRWAPVEVKLGSKEIEDGAEHLLSLEHKVDEEKMGLPTFKMVVTGGQYAYKRDDGVFVVPLGCLRN